MAERTNPHANLIIGAQDEASPVFDKIKASSQGMAAGVEQAAAKAGQAVDGIGAGAEKSADKFTRAESLMRAAIMKSTRELELLGKTASQRFEAQIDFKGLEKAKFQDAISGLQAMESALSVAKAREAEFAAQNGFSLKAAQAKELVKASEYARWWAQELEKVEAAEKRLAGQNSFINSLKSQADAIGKTKADLLEMQAAQMGVATQAAPFIARMREAEAGVGKMGISAAQTAAALRGVPAQFTDIVTSLQGGQAALTVFLQQGGQLKDMFGGAGNAARALGGYVLGLVNPFTIAAAAVAGIAVAYNQGAKEADAYRAALVTTGNAAGTTATQLKSYAQEISGVVGTQGKAAESLAAMAATGKIGAESLREAAQAAVAYERATGQAVGKTAEQFASLRGDPLSAVLKLNDSMNFLTESTYRQIKSLEEQGKTAEAANVAQRAFADTLSGRAGEMERNLGTVERGWLAVKDAAKSAWDAILNVGRASTSVDQLAEVRKQIAQRENQIANGGFGTNEGGAAFGRPSQAATERLRAELAGLQAKAAALEGVSYATKVSADEERKRGEAVKAGAAFDKAGEKFLSDKTRMERELAAARLQGAEAGRSQAEIEKRLGEIRASYAKKGGGGVAAENKELRDQQRIFAELAGVSSTYYAELANAQKQRAAGVITEQQYVTAVQSLIEKQPFAVALAKEEAAAAKALSKAYAEAAAERIKTIQSMERAADSLQSQNDALREEIELIGLSTDQQTLVLQQRNDVIILTKEATLAELERQSAITGTQTRVEIALASEIDALKERNALLGAKGVKNAAVDAAKTAKDEWQKTTDSINQSLTDSLMRGFESGKDFAKNLRDTVVNMFKTMVLRPVISAIVNPVAGAVTGMMGLSGAANAAAAPSGVDVVGATSNGMSMLNTGINSAVQGTFSKFALSETGKSLGLSMAGPDASGYNMLSGTGQQMSQALGVVGDTLAGYAMGSMARSLISNGYSVGKGMDTFQKVGIAVGSAIGGPVMGTIIGAGAGVFNQLFGRKLKDSGIQGTFGGTEGFEGEKYDFYKGGVFRSDKTKTSPLDQGTTDALTQQFRAIQLSTGLMAETLGLASGSVASFTKDIKLSFKGLTEEQIQEKMAAEFTAISDEMAGQVLGTQQSEYAKANETASQTLNRLATSLITVNSAFELLGVTMLEASIASGDMASRLIEQSGGGEAFAANLGTYYDNFYDQAEKTAYVTEQVTAALASVGLQMPATRDEFRALVESQLALGESGAEAVAALLGVSGAFASVTESAADAQQRLEEERQQQLRLQLQQQQDAAKAAHDSAVRAAEGALDAMSVFRDIAAESVDALTGIFETIRANVRELYSEVDGAAAMQVSQANAFIDQALLTAQTTGYMPDGAKLSEAIGTARSGLSSGSYASQFEADSDRLVLAGKLSALGEITGEQLTTAERQLSYAEQQIEQLRQQIDIAGSTRDAVIGVSDAINNLAAEWKFGMGYAKDPVRFQEEFNYGRGPSSKDVFDADQVAKLTSLRSMLQAEYGSGTPEDLARIASLAKSSGASMADIGAALGFWESDIRKIFEGAGIPAFAVGTNYVPRDMLAQIHEGEAIVPKAYNPAANPGMGGGNSEVVSELRALREENRQQAGEIARLNLRMARVLEKFDGDGMPATREEAVA